MSSKRRFAVLAWLLMLASSCGSEPAASSSDPPSLFAETQEERGAAFEAIARSLPAEIIAFDSGVYPEIEFNDESAQSVAVYAASDIFTDYDAWLAEAWAMHQGLEAAGFTGVHFNCFESLPGLRALYQNSDEALLALDWPSVDGNDRGVLSANFLDSQPQRLDTVRILPARNPEMCLPPNT